MLSHCRPVAIPVNTPPSTPTSTDPADQRLYLRDQELDQAAALIRAAARKLSHQVQKEEAADALSAPEVDILEEVFDLGPLDVGELRSRLGAPKQSLARHLNDLESAGLVQRTTDPRDKRRRVVALTEKGSQMTSEATEKRRLALREAFLNAGPEAVAGARQVLQHLARGRRPV